MWRTIIGLFIALLIGILAGTGLYFQHVLTSGAGSGNQIHHFVITKESSTSKIAEDLHRERLIKSPFVFAVYVKMKHRQLQAGRYVLKPTMTIDEIATKLANGEVEGITVTFPEGWRITQMAERLEAKEIVKAADFIETAKGKEGYLFPDTYTFPTNATALGVVEVMKRNFERRTSGLDVTPDVLIMASIVEREAQKDEDRPMVAGVYTNRLKKWLEAGS